jgi:hypothetical protein
LEKWKRNQDQTTLGPTVWEHWWPMTTQVVQVQCAMWWVGFPIMIPKDLISCSLKLISFEVLTGDSAETD